VMTFSFVRGRGLNFSSHPDLHLHIDKKMSGEKSTLPLFNKKTTRTPDGSDQGMESRIPGSGWRNRMYLFDSIRQKLANFLARLHSVPQRIRWYGLIFRLHLLNG
jgi:hypothetical protein